MKESFIKRVPKKTNWFMCTVPFSTLYSYVPNSILMVRTAISSVLREQFLSEQLLIQSYVVSCVLSNPPGGSTEASLKRDFKVDCNSTVSRSQQTVT